MNGQDLGSAIQKVVELSANMKPTIAVTGHEPAGYYHLLKPDGTAQLTLARRPWRNVTIQTPESMLRYIEDNEKANAGDAGLAGGEIYVNSAGVTYVEDRVTRKDTATCALAASAQMLALEELEADELLTQFELLRLLRYDLRGCVSEELVQMVRKVRFERSTVAEGDRGAQRESLSRSVIAEVTAAALVPEEVVVSCSFWERFQTPVKVLCYLECKPAEERFRFVPFPGELDRAEQEAVSRLAKEFEGLATVPTYRGLP